MRQVFRLVWAARADARRRPKLEQDLEHATVAAELRAIVLLPGTSGVMAKTPRRRRGSFLDNYRLDDSYLLKPDRRTGRPGLLTGFDPEGDPVVIKMWQRQSGAQDTDLEERRQGDMTAVISDVVVKGYHLARLMRASFKDAILRVSSHSPGKCRRANHNRVGMGVVPRRRESLRAPCIRKVGAPESFDDSR